MLHSAAISVYVYDHLSITSLADTIVSLFSIIHASNF